MPNLYVFVNQLQNHKNTHFSCLYPGRLPACACWDKSQTPPPPIKDRGFIEFVYRVTSTVLQLAVHDFSGLLCGSGELKLHPCFLLRGLKRFFMFCPSNIVQLLRTLRNDIFGVSQKCCSHLHHSLLPLSVCIHVFLFIYRPVAHPTCHQKLGNDVHEKATKKQICFCLFVLITILL